MKLGNFFDAVGTDAVTAVNPLPIAITLVSRGDMMPNGKANPGGRPIRARGTACVIEIEPRELVRSRVRGRTAALELVEPMANAKTKAPAPLYEQDVEVVVIYEQLRLAVHEWEESTQVVGPPLFDSLEIAMDLVPFYEAQRIMDAYKAYVKDEHEPPAEADKLTRNKSPGRGAGVAPRAPR